MSSCEIDDLFMLASNNDRSAFDSKIYHLLRSTTIEQASSCERTFYNGIVSPNNLVRIATESGEPSSCFYELVSNANPTKIMAQISSEINRLTNKSGKVRTEAIYAYTARTGIAFKAIKVTFSPFERDSLSLKR